MPLRLNLGAGRAHLPTSHDNKFTAHQHYALDVLLPSAYDPHAGWQNVDREPLPGIHEVVDLFCYPFIRQSNNNPYSDSSVDEILCSHLVEHIPHEAKLNGGGMFDKALQQAAKLDGWYAFFYECWRILKPNGRLLVIAPFVWSGAAISDPTHTRYLEPESFSYFIPNPNAPFDYRIPCRFTQEASPLLAITPLGNQAMNEAEARILGGRHKASLTPDELDHLNNQRLNAARHTIDGVTEFAYALVAIKD